MFSVPIHSLEKTLGLPALRFTQGRNIDYYPKFLLNKVASLIRQDKIYWLVETCDNGTLAVNRLITCKYYGGSKRKRAYIVATDNYVLNDVNAIRVSTYVHYSIMDKQKTLYDSLETAAYTANVKIENIKYIYDEQRRSNPDMDNIITMLLKQSEGEIVYE